MTARKDIDLLIHHFLLEGEEELQDQIYDAVRTEIEKKRQRVFIGPWRFPDMNKFVTIGLGAVAAIAILFVGVQLFGSNGMGLGTEASAATPTATPSPTPVGGNVQYQLDGAPASIEVEAVADGGNVSGTAISTFVGGTHTVRLECAVQDRDTWAFGGTTEQTTVPRERAGDWSAVIVRDGSPQLVGIWLSDAKSDGIDCDGWLTSIHLADIDAANLAPVESGALVPPPNLAP